MFTLTVYHVGMFAEFVTDSLQHGIVFLLVLLQLRKNKCFQCFHNTIEADGYRIGRPYHRVKFLFLVVTDKTYNSILPFVDFGKFGFDRFGGIGEIDICLVDIPKSQFHYFRLFQRIVFTYLFY